MKIFGTVPLLWAIPLCLSAKAPLGRVSLIPSAISSTTPTLAPTPTPVPTPDWRHDPTRQSKHVHDFFKSFGWLKHDTSIKDRDMPAAIRKIQKMLHEPETGLYDERMEKVMSKPRCGTEQPYNETDAELGGKTPQKRYVLWYVAGNKVHGPPFRPYDTP